MTTIITILALSVGILLGFLATMAFFGYFYYKAWKEAHDEGWDLPS